jgi:hypothetical protein
VARKVLLKDILVVLALVLTTSALTHPKMGGRYPCLHCFSTVFDVFVSGIESLKKLSP